MLSLFQAAIESVAGDTARIRFEVCRFEQREVPCTKVFALQALVDAYWMMRKGRVWGGVQAMSDNEARELANGHPQRAQLDAWLQLARPTAPISKEDHDRMMVDGFGSDPISWVNHDTEDGWFKAYPTNHAAFREAAERAIVAVELQDEQDNPRRSPTSPYPKATVVIRVANPTWLAHLAPGLRWATDDHDYTGAPTE